MNENQFTLKYIKLYRAIETFADISFTDKKILSYIFSFEENDKQFTQSRKTASQNLLIKQNTFSYSIFKLIKCGYINKKSNFRENYKLSNYFYEQYKIKSDILFFEEKKQNEQKYQIIENETQQNTNDINIVMNTRVENALNQLVSRMQ